MSDGSLSIIKGSLKQSRGNIFLLGPVPIGQGLMVLNLKKVDVD